MWPTVEDRESNNPRRLPLCFAQKKLTTQRFRFGRENRRRVFGVASLLTGKLDPASLRRATLKARAFRASKASPEGPISVRYLESQQVRGQPWRRGATRCGTSRFVCSSPLLECYQWSLVPHQMLTVVQVSIKKILNLNETLEPSENDVHHANGVLAPSAPILKDGTPIWKLLVFDVSSDIGIPPAG